MLHIYIYDISSLRINDLMRPEFSGQIFEKYSNIKSHENSSIERRIVTCMRADERTGRQRQDEANSRFSQFCEKANNSCLVDRLPNV